MFCKWCGSEVEKDERCSCGFSSVYHICNSDWYCEQCGSPIPAKPFPRILPNGKTDTGYSHVSVCENCPPINDRMFTPSMWAQRLCVAYPERVQILFECTCKNVKKIKHHPRYEKPFEVIVCCTKCHMAEHKRLRDLAKSAQAEAI